RILRVHGARRKYFSEVIGVNSRLDELQAAVLRVKLRHVDSWIAHKRSLALAYDEGLRAFPDFVQPPIEAAGNVHTYHQYVIRVKRGRRDGLQRRLADEGIASAVYYPQLLHLQQCFASLEYRVGDMPRAEQALGEILSLPLWSEMPSEQVRVVTGAMGAYFGELPSGECV
ncbi:MAG TPA: DegT/DnrJ/EryC1/StrS family aminotransferase, partial [Clostridia bacterium]|nr:DegT/DnrJ/EryC1/StrS family aminotransferase [Clostridia bacterium]